MNKEFWVLFFVLTSLTVNVNCYSVWSIPIRKFKLSKSNFSQPKLPETDETPVILNSETITSVGDKINGPWARIGKRENSSREHLKMFCDLVRNNVNSVDMVTLFVFHLKCRNRLLRM